MGGVSVSPVGFGDISAWAGLRRIVLADWEITALRRMDSARRKVLMASAEEVDKPPEKLTPALFREMFSG